MEEIADESVMYFDSYDVDSIATVIISFLKSGAVSIDHENLKKYTWRRSAENLLEIFTEVASHKT